MNGVVWGDGVKIGAIALDGMGVEETMADLSAGRCPYCKLPIQIDEKWQDIRHVEPEHEEACSLLHLLSKGAKT